MSYPTKAERTVCYAAREKYWECLDSNGEKDSVKTGPCEQFRKIYEKSCTPQWVTHFDRKRNYLQYKEKIETDGIPNKNINDRSFGAKRRIYSEIAIT